MYRQYFHLQTLTVPGPCHFSILKASYALIWISVRLEVQDSEVRPLWHCNIWPWPQWTIVEQYVSKFSFNLVSNIFSCVETATIGFSLHSRDHLQTSASQVFTDLDFSGSPAELELVFLCFPCILMVHRAQKSCSVNSILVVTNPNFLHELAPLYVQTGFPSSDIDMSRYCDFSIVQACIALIWNLR